MDIDYRDDEAEERRRQKFEREMLTRACAMEIEKFTDQPGRYWRLPSRGIYLPIP